MTLDRRSLLAGLAGVALAAPASVRAASDDAHQFPLRDETGAPVVNYRLPAQLTTDSLPGVIWTGSAKPDVTLVEFFDYNCPYCRKAVRDLDRRVVQDRNFRLGLVNNAVLSLGSVQAAKVALAVAKLKGDVFAYRYHVRLLEMHGTADGQAALDLAATMGLDRALVERTGNDPAIGDKLREQAGLASSLGFVATPSFIIGGVGVLGYPGARTIGEIVAAMRKCQKVVCSS